MSEDEQSLRGGFARVQLGGIILAVVGLALCVFGALTNPHQFYFSYLFGYVFWIGLGLGCFALVMIHHLTGGGWGFLIRRMLEAGVMTLPIMAVLFLPFFLGLHELYSWSHPEIVAHDEALQHKHLYLNLPAFAIRSAVLFALWTVCALLLNRWSFRQDATEDPAPTRWLRTLSGPGLVLYALTGTLAAVDWVMVLENDWYSTIFPLQLMIGQMLATLALCITLLAWFGKHEPLRSIVKPEHFHALGNLLLAFVMLWAYMAVSQLIIIWSGNLPREISWYLHRSTGGWKWVVVFVVVFYFFVPFSLLLARQNKTNVRPLCAIALGVFCVHFVEVFWFVAPSLHGTGFGVSWLDFTAAAGIGGVWVAAFFGRLKNHPLMPSNDPRLPETFANGN